MAVIAFGFASSLVDIAATTCEDLGGHYHFGPWTSFCVRVHLGVGVMGRSERNAVGEAHGNWEQVA